VFKILGFGSINTMKEVDFLRLYKKILPSLMSRVMGVLFVVVFNIWVARALGANDAGLLFLSLTIVFVVSVAGRLGMDNVVLRFVSAGYSVQNWAEIFWVLKLASKVILSPIVFISSFLYFFAEYLAIEVFSNELLTDVFRSMAFAIPAYSFVAIFSEALKGLKYSGVSQIFQVGLIPLVALLGIVLMDATDVLMISIIYSASCFIVLVLLLLFLSVVISKSKGEVVGICRDLNPRRDKIFCAAKELYVVSLLMVVMDWNAVILLGIFASPSEVAIFQVSMKVALLVNFVLAAVNSVIAPGFSELFELGKKDELKSLAQQSTFKVTLFVMPLVLLLLVFSDKVLFFFGAEFVIGSGVLELLVIGRFFTVATGSACYLMIMTGNERAYKRMVVKFALLGVIMNYILVVNLGLIGVAFGVALTTAMFSVYAMYVVKRKLGFYIWTFI
jgi:O-antigen/teichoic acid export membrane protein